jgi:short-subunit dehydrogenase
MDVLIFTTSVSAPEQVNRVQPILTSVQAIQDFNFDLDDCDNILRVVSDDLSPRYIETLLNNAGFTCTELEY